MKVKAYFNPQNIGGFRVVLLAILPFVYTTALSQLPHPPFDFINLPGGSMPAKTILNLIKTTTHYPILYGKGMNPNRIINTPAGKLSFEEALQLCLAGQGLTYSFWGKTISIDRIHPGQQNTLAPSAPAQTFTVKATVENDRGEPLPGANLSPKNHPRQITPTNDSGIAIIHTSRIPDTFYCTHTGYDTAIIISAASGMVEIKMKPRKKMNEIFVTGYRTGQKIYGTGDWTLVGRGQLEHQSVSDPVTALAGRVPGLLITQSGGVPGASSSVTLRGKMSLLNSGDPLYIIDGVPYSPGGQSVSYIERGNSGNSLSPTSFLSLDDIESMEILKDADATAIYGSKGANGVILITTRYGAAGKRKLNINLSTGYSQITRSLKLMNTRQYSSMRQEAIMNDGLTPDATSAPELFKWDTTRSTDWGKWLIGETGRTAKGRMSLSGGSDKINYFLGAGYLWETNVFRTQPTHDLLNLHGNLNYLTKDDRLNIQLSGLFGHDNNHQFITDLTSLQFLTPNAPYLWDKYGKPIFQANGVDMDNPVSSIGNTYKARSDNFLLSGNFLYKLWDALMVRVLAGFNNVKVNEYSQIPIWTQAPGPDPGFPLTGSSFYANSGFRNYVLEPQLEYPISKGDWKIGLLAGASWQGQRSTMKTIAAEGFTNDSLLQQLALAGTLTRDSQIADYQYKAFFGRANINWKNRYVLNITARRDGSSRFSPAKRYGTFGAAGFAWIFSKERFFSRLSPLVSLGKIRASYGTTGNDLIGGGNRYIQSWAPTSFAPFQNIPGANATGPISPDVTWETIKKLEFAMDLNLLRDRLLFTASWYRNRADHQLLPDFFPLTGSAITLHNQPVVLQNSGWEFSIVSKIVDTKKFGWTTSVNASFPISRLVAFPGIATSVDKDLVVGQSVNVLRGFVFSGVNTQNGRYQFKDLNGDDTLTSEDRKVIGKLDVTAFGGIENTFRYGNWQFQAMLEWRIQTGSNYQAVILTDNPPGSTFSGLYSNETTAMLNRWRKPGDRATYQKLSANGDPLVADAATKYLGSSAMLTNASFARLKTVSLSWSWPTTLLKKVNLQEGRLCLEAQNFFTFTPYKGPDPENQSVLALPPLKTIVLRLQVSI